MNPSDFRVLGTYAKRLPSGFLFLPVHYSHDPDKTPEWALAMRAKFPRPVDFDKEMEIDFALHIGTPAYPRFSDAKHLGTTIYDPRRPLSITFDFNVNPMTLIVGQVHESIKQIHVLRSLVYPATIDQIVNDFRNHYSDHKADLVMYGDGTKGTTPQTSKSNWDIVRLSFRGYHIPLTDKVPESNPLIGNRLNSVNRMLQGEGPYTVVIDDNGDNEELIRDLREVIMTPDGKRIHKINDQDDPYYFRTHASDALGYWFFREWPTVAEVMASVNKKREPLQPGNLLGEIDYGPAWRKEREHRAKMRRPLDKSRAR